MSILAAVPIKPFGVAKARLAPLLDAATRSRLGRAIAAHTVATLDAAGVEAAVVTGSDEVAAWAESLGIEVIAEPSGAGLDGAASTAAAAAVDRGQRWLVVHADLPLLDAAAVGRLRRALDAGPVIAPSIDGGTSVLGGAGPFDGFAYGPGSFHRHLRRLPHATVVIDHRVAIDLDGPDDLRLILADPASSWLRSVLGDTVSG